MKVWITKYALSRKGLHQKSGIIGSPSWNKTQHKNMFVVSPFEKYAKHEWVRTKKEAIARAEAMRAKKVIQLQKSIDRLQRKKFR